MNHKLINRILAGIVFLFSFIIYLSTAQPSVSFWDCGEFAGASYSLQVPHPPGAPLFLLIGRLFMMFPFAENLGFRMNMVSILSSAITIMFLYLIIVKLITFWRGEKPSNLGDAISCYGGALIGALTFTFTDTFWFNAVESEVYAFSMFFVSIIVWIMVLWYEKADEPGNEKYIFMFAYLVGLSIGVHLLTVLAILSFIMMIYFRKYEFSFQSFLIMGVVAVISFWIVYPGVVKFFPKLLASFGGTSLFLKLVIIFAFVGLLVYLMYFTKVKNYPIAFIGITSLFLIFIGFTTYTMVIIRSNAFPPMNENEPDTMNELVYYLNREQYGDFPVFKRRYSNEPHQQAIYTDYSSDVDFMWRYQIDHMFNRYLYWNFVGREGDIQDAKSVWFGNGNPAYQEGSKEFPNKYYGIPLLLGLFGLYWHFKKDWKMALSFLSIFILMGVLTALYQNQQEPQPRERDYFYVGAFFIYAIWIGIAITGLMELIKEKLNNDALKKFLPYGILAFGLYFGPINMAVQNWGDHDRSENYIPWDFAYNLLQSCEPNGILVTNGDNDTFPLWYLQDVEGVRRDVRIVNLSLANTDWYVNQLKNEQPYGANKVPISMPDEQIRKLQPTYFEPTVINLPITDEIIKKYNITDTAALTSKQVSYVMRNTLDFGENQKGLRMQDIVMLDIIQTNAARGWKTPIHFSITCSDDAKVSTDQYLTRVGMTYLLTPVKNTTRGELVNTEVTKKHLFDEPTGYSKSYQPGFKFRGLREGKIYLNENERRMLMNYASTFLSLSLHQLEMENDTTGALKTLNKYEEILNPKFVKIDYRFLSNISGIYLNAGNKEKFLELSKYVEPDALKAIELNPGDIGGYYSPYRILIQIYEIKGEYQKEIDLLNKALLYNPNDPGIRAEIQRIQSIKDAQKK